MTRAELGIAAFTLLVAAPIGASLGALLYRHVARGWARLGDLFTGWQDDDEWPG